MKQGIFALVMVCLAACSKDSGGGGAGNPAKLKAAQELADKGCACTDSKCLWDVKSSDGQGAEMLMASEKDLSSAEKTAFEAAANKYNTCAAKIGGAK